MIFGIMEGEGESRFYVIIEENLVLGYSLSKVMDCFSVVRRYLSFFSYYYYEWLSKCWKF